MSGSIDFAALEALAASAGYVDAPRGMWDMEITKAEHKLSSEATGKKDMFQVSLKIVSGPHQGATHRHLFVISPESPGALGITLRYLTALGLDAEYRATSPKNDQIARDLVGRRAKVVIGDDRRDATRTAVTNMSPLDGATPVTRTSGADASDPFAVFTPVDEGAQAAATSDGAPVLPF